MAEIIDRPCFGGHRGRANRRARSGRGGRCGHAECGALFPADWIGGDRVAVGGFAGWNGAVDGRVFE